MICKPKNPYSFTLEIWLYPIIATLPRICIWKIYTTESKYCYHVLKKRNMLRNFTISILETLYNNFIVFGALKIDWPKKTSEHSNPTDGIYFPNL